MSKPKIILIAGPTASGKSALALEIARREQGSIINADSMQVYAGLPILTAQPSAEEQKEVPHRLYGVIDAGERSSAGKWLALAQEAIRKVVEQGRTPVLVGGTGLYFGSLLGRLSDIPAIPEEVRERTQNLYDEIGEEKFREKLAKLDAESPKRFARNDRQRLIRAYEVAVHTGKPIGDWHSASGIRHSRKKEIFVPGCQMLNAESHLLMPPRDELYAACDRRFEKMIEQGAIEEVKQFLKRNLAPELPAMKTIGVREIASYLRGEVTLAQAIAKAQQMTRNYAKRQMTWFRNQWPFNPS